MVFCPVRASSDNEMFANAIEFVPVDASEKRFRKSLLEFQIEDFEVQTQGVAASTSSRVLASRKV